METERLFIEGQHMDTQTVQSNICHTYTSIYITDIFYHHFKGNLPDLQSAKKKKKTETLFRPTVNYDCTIEKNSDRRQ